MTLRADGRTADQLRTVTVERGGASTQKVQR